MTQSAELREHILACTEPACQATKKLLQSGAGLRLGMGRHCEIAVVAAAGTTGVRERDIVGLRRKYAEHLGVKLGGPVQDAETPVHVEHAIENYSGNPAAKWPINLGTARASREGDRYFIHLARGGR